MSLISCIGLASFENRSTSKTVSSTIHDNQSITDCLDDGYSQLKDLSEMMEDYNDLLKKQSETSRSVKDKWKLRLHQQRSIFSYNTTKKVQQDLLNSNEQHASLIDAQIQSIENLIKEFHSHIRKLYIRKTIPTQYQHYQTKNLKKDFAVASQNLRKLHENLERLQNKEKREEKHFYKVKSRIQTISDQTSIEKNDLKQLIDEHKEIKRRLKNIRLEIVELNEQIEDEKPPFEKFLVEFFDRCKQYEQERIELIRKTLLTFIQVSHPSSNSIAFESISSNVRTKIELTQDSLADLQFWSGNFGVNS